MTETPQADDLLIDLMSREPQIEDFANLTDEHEQEVKTCLCLKR